MTLASNKITWKINQFKILLTSKLMKFQSKKKFKFNKKIKLMYKMRFKKIKNMK